MKKILYALLAFTLGAACCACNDDDDPVVVASELEITPPQLVFEYNSTESQVVTVKTDGSAWTAEPDAKWITVTVIACSCAYATPIGIPANTMVVGLGGYKFKDYVKAGLPLIAVSFLVCIVLLPILFPFYG